MIELSLEEQQVIEEHYTKVPTYSDLNPGDMFRLHGALADRSNFYFEWSHRAALRNQGRGVLSRSMVLSQIAGVPYFPEVGLVHVAREKIPYLLESAANLVSEGRANTRQAAIRILEQEVPLPLDFDKLRLEEAATMLARQVEFYLEKKNYAAAKELCIRKVSTELQPFVEKEIRATVGKIFARAVKSVIKSNVSLNNAIATLPQRTTMAQIRRKRMTMGWAGLFLGNDISHLKILYLDFVRPLGVQQEDTGLNDEILSYPAIYDVLQRCNDIANFQEDRPSV